MMMVNKKNLSIAVVVVLLITAYLGVDLNQPSTPIAQSVNLEQSTIAPEQVAEAKLNVANQHDLQLIQHAYQNKLSNIQVQAMGRVKAILADDNQGSRHQKFILTLDNGLTVLVAHNIDLSAKIENLHPGDTVEFFGEYEYNPQGGIIHWTHYDPQQRHPDGWLKHDGRVYQ